MFLLETLPIFIGGAIRGVVEMKQKKEGEQKTSEEEDLGKGNLFATGLVAGGAVAGVIIAFISGSDGGEKFLNAVSLEQTFVDSLSKGGYFILGTCFFAAMGTILYRVARK